MLVVVGPPASVCLVLAVPVAVAALTWRALSAADEGALLNAILLSVGLLVWTTAVQAFSTIWVLTDGGPVNATVRRPDPSRSHTV